MTARKKNRGIVYIRRSSSRQELSLAAQLEWAIREADEREVPLDAELCDIARMQNSRLSVSKSIYLDDSISGADLNRPGFLALLRGVEADISISHVFINRRDRFARPEEAAEMLVREKRLRQCGVTIVFCDKVAGPLERGQLNMAEDLAVLFEYHQSGEFLVTLAERVIAAQRTLALGGYWTGGDPPFGFVRVLVDANGNELEELLKGRRVRQAGCHVRIKAKDPEKIAIWLLIIDLADQGWGGKRIAQHLNNLGIPSPGAGRTRTDHGVQHVVSGKWGHRTVLELLRNRAILGEQTYGTRAEGEHRRLGGDGPRLLNEGDRKPDGLPRLVYNPTELIITAETGFGTQCDLDKWDAVQERLNRRAKCQQGIPRVRDPARYPLSTRVLDLTENCGSIMYARTSGQRRQYLCGRYLRTCGAECENNAVDAEALLKMTLATIGQVLLRPSLRERLRERLELLAKNDSDSGTRTDLTDQLAALRKRKAELKEDLDTAGYRMSVEKDDDRYEALSAAFSKIKQQSQLVAAQIKELECKSARREIGTSSDEVSAAMNVLENIERLVADNRPRAELPAMFANLGLRIGLNFGAGRKGKRTIRKLLGGAIVFGNAELSVRLHGESRVDKTESALGASDSAERISGSNAEYVTQERDRKIADGDGSSNASPPGHFDGHQKGISYTKVNRGDMI